MKIVRSLLLTVGTVLALIIAPSVLAEKAPCGAATKPCPANGSNSKTNKVIPNKKTTKIEKEPVEAEKEAVEVEKESAEVEKESVEVEKESSDKTSKASKNSKK